jgi:hypothetical protein
MMAHASIIVLLSVSMALGLPRPLADAVQDTVVVDNFESDAPGEHPNKWVYVAKNESIIPISKGIEQGETFEVQEENGNRFIRTRTEDEALRFSVVNGRQIEWNLKENPRLQWRWRAIHLPEGASEKGKNDTGGAVYVTFGKDWIGRPKSIKYTYSSSLPVGTVVSYGPLKVIVVDSKREPRTGEWKTVQRRITDDYRQVFGGKPPNRPVSITIWNDSDTTHDKAIVDFDDIELLPPLR